MQWKDGHWVFGGVERITRNTFGNSLIEILNRDMMLPLLYTLLPITQRYIKISHSIEHDKYYSPSLNSILKHFIHHQIV